MKNSRYTYLTFVLILIILASCSSKPDLAKIYENLESVEALEVDTSMIFSKVGISVKEFERELNNKLGMTLYEDDEYQNRNGVLLKLKIDRTGDIILHSDDGLLKYSIPVKVNGRVLIDQKILGARIRAEPGFELELALNLSTSIEFQDNLKMNTNTEISSIEWPDKPKIQAGPIVIDLTQALESVIYSFQTDLSEIIQKSVQEELDLRELVNASMGNIPVYNYIKTKDIDLWIKLEPIELLLQSKPVFKNDSINVRAGISSKLTIVDAGNDSSFVDGKALNIKSISKSPDNFEINLKLELSYESLDSLIEKKLDKMDLGKLAKDYSIIDIKTGKFNDDDFYLSAAVEGKIEGQLISKGLLVYDSLEKSLKLKKSSTAFYSSNWFANILSSLFFNSAFINIEEKAKWPLEPLFKRVQVSVLKLMDKISPDNKVKLSLEDLNFKVNEILLRKDKIELLIQIEGKSEFQLSI